MAKANSKNTPPAASKKSIPASKPGQSDFPIVGVGASAGGLEAFGELLLALPANPGMAFVFVQHLDPKHVSVLAQLLGRESKMPVSEARDGIKVNSDNVYVIPKNTSISISKGLLRLGPREMVGGHFTSIDTFLQSLAEDRGAHAIGVLLSGSASDGSLGLKAIKAAGGITFAQDPASAKFDSMPRSAIVAGCVDFIHKPAEIASELLQFGQYRSPDSGRKPEDSKATSEPEAISQILATLRTATGVDFTNYKSTTVKRRILRRMLLRRIGHFEGYLSLLRAEPNEARSLYEDILINVTEFFRDPEAFEAFARRASQILSSKKGGDRQIRIWVPGCSTGEEVYSLVIALLESLDREPDRRSLQVFATDLSEATLEKARAAIYPGSIKDHVSAERLRRFFVKHDSSYRVNKRVRDLCVFARHNLTADPPFSKLDLISCRNVLIYLGPVLQKRVIAMFHYALNPDGLLLLGSSETIGQHGDTFQLLDKKNKIYRRKPGRARAALDFSSDLIRTTQDEAPRKADTLADLDLQHEADRMILTKYGPPGVVVDDDLNILQFRGQTNHFIEPASGTASLSLLRMVKEDLTATVKNAVARARRDNISVRREGLRLTTDASSEISLEVIPFRRQSGRDRKYLIVFQNSPVKVERKGTKGKGISRQETQLHEENARLRQELGAAREYLQSIIEDQEAAQEELRSAAEEIQSSNEELQSTNEELETAKEELQSTNEELNTVNEELQNRNMQLSQVGNDLLNLLVNVNMPVLILGNDHRIRRFTSAAEKALHLIPSDVGRPIRDINLHIQVPKLESIVGEVLEGLAPKIVEVTDEEGRVYSLRVRPYRTDDNQIDGVVMLFIEVDQVMRTGLNHPEQVPSAASGPGGAGAAVLLAQEEERRRVAHELHDELNQKLALLEFNVQSLAAHASEVPEEIQRQLGDFRKRVADLSDHLRRLAYQLHPVILDDLGLIVALQAYCDDYSSREGIQVRFSNRDVPADLSPTVSIVCYRVVQECLRNVAKHSGAKRATVNIRSANGHLELVVRDAGTGFQADTDHNPGLGIRGLRERVAFVGGSIQWKSKAGEGTAVTVIIPVNTDGNSAANGTQA